MQINNTDILGANEISFPAELNINTPEKESLYRASMEFERTFVSFMMRQMDNATKALGSDDDESSGATSAYQDMAKDQLTQAVLDGGGLGLASTLYQQMAANLDESAGGVA